MECNYNIMHKAHKRSSREIMLMVGIVCFIISISIGMILKIFAFLYMLIPMLYLVILFVKISKRKNMLVPGKIRLMFEDEFIVISETDLNNNIIKEEKTYYKDINDIQIYENGNVMIKTKSNNYDFWLNEEDKKQLRTTLDQWVSHLKNA